MSVENLAKQFESYHSETTKLANDFSDLREVVNGIEAKLGRPLATFIGDEKSNVVAECKALAGFVRHGDDREFKNALMIGDDVAGGYLEFPAQADSIRVKQFDAAPMLGLVDLITMGAGSSWQQPIDVSDAEASWSAEAETRSETSAGNFGLIDIPLDESTALVKLTQRLLDDAKFDVAQYVLDKLVGRFGRLADVAFVNGDGLKKPKGFLAYPTATTADAMRASGTYQYVPSGAATALTADGIINTSYSLRAPYRANATWVMSSDTARQVRLLKDGNGAYILAPSLAAAAPDLLCGKPVVYDENMPAVGAGTYPIAIADFKRAYVAVQRPGIKFLRDPYSAKPHILLYGTQRVGGQSSGDFDALKLMKVGTA